MHDVMRMSLHRVQKVVEAGEAEDGRGRGGRGRGGRGDVNGLVPNAGRGGRGKGRGRGRGRGRGEGRGVMPPVPNSDPDPQNIIPEPEVVETDEETRCHERTRAFALGLPMPEYIGMNCPSDLGSKKYMWTRRKRREVAMMMMMMMMLTEELG